MRRSWPGSGASRPSRCVVADYDEAIAWYTEKLGFALVEDVDLGGGKRWVTCRAGDGGARLLLARRRGDEQQLAHRQPDRRPRLPVPGDRRFRPRPRGDAGRGVQFREAPRHEAYGTVAVFADLYGNLWDLIEPKRLNADAAACSIPDSAMLRCKASGNGSPNLAKRGCFLRKRQPISPKVSAPIV